MAKRVKIGDVFPIVTFVGIAFALITHRNKQYGFLIRVFPVCSQETELEQVVQKTPLFSTFFPVQAAINQGLFTIFHNNNIPGALADFPIFRCEMPNLEIKKKEVSWLWDGEKSIKRNRDFNEIEKTFPVRQIISAPVLIEKIEQLSI